MLFYRQGFKPVIFRGIANCKVRKQQSSLSKQRVFAEPLLRNLLIGTTLNDSETNFTKLYFMKVNSFLFLLLLNLNLFIPPVSNAQNFPKLDASFLLKKLEPPKGEVRMVLDLVKKAQTSVSENPLYVDTTGCLTNIASAMLIEPTIIEKIVVVWLGGNGLNWPNQKEFNLMQDVKAAQVVFNSGVPLVIMPCHPVVSHFHTTIPELEYYLKGKNKISDYLLNSTIEYSGGRDTWSKAIWDVVAVAWLVNPIWIPTNLELSPILSDQITYSFDHSRHFIRMANTLNRDAIFRDLFRKLTK